MSPLASASTPSSFSFAGLPPVEYGPGSIKKLGALAASRGRRALLVIGGSSLEKSGRLNDILANLSASGLAVEMARVTGEPSVEFIDETVASPGSAGVEVVLGVGGGSVVDAAKALAAMLGPGGEGRSIQDFLEGVGKNLKYDGRKLPFIAAPTTSGTGGEVTKNAVISRIGVDGFKKSIRHDRLVPDQVILDPELMIHCPPAVSAACGMDAFTQLLEPYLSPRASVMTDALAWRGMELVADSLVPVCTDRPDDLEARGNMALGALFSGAALANAGLGIVHGLASPLGGFFPIPHGVICGTFVAEATRANIRALRDRDPFGLGLLRFARAGALCTGMPEAAMTLGEMGADARRRRDFLCDALVAMLDDWTERLAMPRLGEFGVRAADLDRILDGTSNRDNPVQLSRAEIAALIESRL